MKIREATQKVLNAYEEVVSEAKEEKSLSSSKIKWAATRYKDIMKAVKDLESEMASGDRNAMRASLGNIKSLIGFVERGLGL
jgi:hypothetical protein